MWLLPSLDSFLFFLYDILCAITEKIDGGLLHLFKYLLLRPWLDFDVEINRSQIKPAILFELVARVGHFDIHVFQ